MRFTFNGKAKLLSLGNYPSIGLKRAREMRDEARVKIAQGIDPALEKQERKKRATAKKRPSCKHIQKRGPGVV
ncbi:MAG: Arm DNA-binding domain-containing protein [Thermodesulfobacteriota bacterium]